LKFADLSHIESPFCIPELTFACSPLVEIVLSDNIVKFEKWAFGECKKLKNVFLPASLTELGYGVFVACDNLETVDFSGVNNLAVLSDSTFGMCFKLTNVVLPDCIEIIEDGAFKDCNNLKSIVFPASLKEIGRGIVESERRVDIDMSRVTMLETIPQECIDIKKPYTLVLPNGVKNIEDDAFYGDLQKLFLPPTIEEIGDFGFYDIDVYCFAPKMKTLGSLVEGLELGQLIRLYVLPDYLNQYVAQRDAEDISEENLSISVIPDDYLYVYDN